MKDFDEILKARAKSESFPISSSLDNRINNIVNNLPKDISNKNKKFSRKILFTAASITALLIVTSVAAPTVVNMSKGTIDYFKLPQEMRFLSKEADYQKYNSNVGMTVEDNGISVKVDNIAVDDNYINVFYTVVSDRPIVLPGDDSDPQKWRTNWAAPGFWFKADGKYIEPAAQSEHEGYLLDEYTLICMQRYTVMDVLPDTFELEIYADNIWNIKGEWYIALSVDKSVVAVDSLTVAPKITAMVTSGWKEKIYNHKITIDKVSISPFGSQVVISERGKNVFDDFVLRDENGGYLSVIPTSVYSSTFFKMTNSFEFISTNTNMESITLVPFYSDSQGTQEIIHIDSLPIAMPINDLGGYILESLLMDDEKMTAILSINGVIPPEMPSFGFIDSYGKDLPYITHMDYDYDRTIAKITLKGYWADNVTPDDFINIDGISYFSNYDIELRENEAINIPLK